MARDTSRISTIPAVNRTVREMGLPLDIPLWLKFVPHSPNGHHPRRTGGILFDFFTQTSDVDSDRAWINKIRKTPDTFEKLIAGEYLARMARKVKKQVKFFRRQRDFPLPQSDQPGLRIDGQVAKHQDAFSQVRRLRAGPAQDR